MSKVEEAPVASPLVSETGAAAPEGVARPAESIPPTDCQAQQAEDRHAAACVVSVMLGIFVLALFLYSYICFWVAGD